MKKVFTFLFAIGLLTTLTGCGNKGCGDGYTKEGDKCVTYIEEADALSIEYVCEEDWHLEGTECVNGTMPLIGDGCEEGTTDRIGEDGFCHHYKEATTKYSCKEGTVLKDNKCYTQKYE